VLPLRADKKTILSINVEVEEIYAQITTQHKRLLEIMHGNHRAMEFLHRIQPKLHRVARELYETPEIIAHQFVRDNIVLSIERDSEKPQILLSLQL
jgi:hypothetical protein